MSHSRQTEHYHLPLYNGTDIINPLTDFNDANSAIDEAIYDANENAADAKSVAETAAGAVSQYDARISAVEAGMSGFDGRVDATQLMIAPAFNPLKSDGYNEGDKVTFEDKFYVFTRNHSGAWSASDVDEITVAEVLGEGSGDYDARITAAQNTADTAVAAASAAQSAADTAQLSANSAQSTAAEALAKASAVRNKKVLIIADSYGMRDVDNNFCKLLTDKYPGIYDTVAEGGYGYTNGTFLTMLTDKLATMTTAEKEAVTDVLFCGGWNDARELKAGRQTAASLVAAIKDTHDYANLNLPNAVCHAVFMGWQTYAHTQEGVDYASLLTAIACYNSYGSGNNAPFESVQYIMRDCANFDNTYFHPNALGGAYLANAVHACVMGGDYHFNTKHEYHVTTSPFDGGVITGFTGGTMRYSIFDGITKINAINVAVNGSPTASMICQFKDSTCPYAFPDDAPTHNIYVPIIFSGTINGESVGYEPLYGILSGNKLNAYYKGGAITSINGIMAFEVTIDNTQWV